MPDMLSNDLLDQLNEKLKKVMDRLAFEERLNESIFIIFKKYRNWLTTLKDACLRGQQTKHLFDLLDQLDVEYRETIVCQLFKRVDLISKPRSQTPQPLVTTITAIPSPEDNVTPDVWPRESRCDHRLDGSSHSLDDKTDNQSIASNDSDQTIIIWDVNQELSQTNKEPMDESMDTTTGRMSEVRADATTAQIDSDVMDNNNRVNRKPGLNGSNRWMKWSECESKSKESLEEIAVNGSVESAVSDADAIAWSHVSGDYATAAEDSFKHFTEYVHKFRSRQKMFEQLSQLEFPIFVYIFIEIYEYDKMDARRFLRDHKSRFKESVEIQTIELMNKSVNSASIESSLKKYKTTKYCVKISDKCLEIIKKHLKEKNDLIIIDIINKSIDCNIYSTHNQNQPELTEKRIEKCPQFMDTESLSVTDVQLSQTQSQDLQDFMQCVDRLRNSPPSRFPIRTFTVNSEDLCCAAVTDDMSALALGFTDSTISLKKFGQNFNRESRFELKRNVCDIRLNLIEHDIEDVNNDREDDDNDDYCHTSGAINGANTCDTNEWPTGEVREDCYRTLRGHGGPVLALKFCPQTDLLLSCSTDTTVRAWDATSGHNVSLYNNHRSSVWALDASLVGNMFCSAGDECVAYLWSLEHSQPIRMFVTNSSCVYCVRFHPNCKYIAFADKEITLWDVNKAQEVRTFVGHEAPVNSLAFSLCGHYLASGGEDRKVIVWDISTGRALKEYTGHTNSIYSLCFNHNNTLLSSCGADQTLRLWNLKNIMSPFANKPLAVTDTDANQNTFRIESDQFMSYQMNSNVIHSQFLPRNLLLTIGKKS